MPRTYTECAEDVKDLADEVLRRWHKHLIDAGVTIKYLFANNDTGDALTHGGYPAGAVVRRTNLKDRVAGLDDVVLIISEPWWNEHSKAECTALLDHEFVHVQLVRDKDGKLETDDAERPKLRLRKHDFQIGGFYEVGERHRMRAPEVEYIGEVQKKFMQMGLFSGNDMMPNPEAAAV